MMIACIKSLALSYLWISTMAWGQTPSKELEILTGLIEKASLKNEMMPSESKYRLETVENVMRRPLVSLTVKEKTLLGLQVNDIAFANFLYQGNFYVARLRKSNTKPSVKQISLAQKHWAAKIRPETKNLEIHSELIFDFNEGQELELVLNQSTAKKLKTPKKVRQAVLSIEAVRSSQNPDAGFMPDALGPHFALAVRILSMADRNRQHEGDPDRIVTTQILDLSDTKSKIATESFSADAVFMTAVKQSISRSRKEAYSLYTNNCTNNLLKILDLSLEYNVSTSKGIETALIGQDVQQFLREDLKNISEFIEKLAAEKLSAEYAPMQVMVQGLLSKIPENSAEQFDINRFSEQETFMASVPAFLDGHLRARGISPKGACAKNLASLPASK